MMTAAKRAVPKIIKKLVIIMLFASLFFLLGVIGGSGWGYHINRIQETSFDPQFGYAEVVFECDMVFNPLLYPFQWITGRGITNGSYSMLYRPEMGRYGMRQDRYPEYAASAASWGMQPNFLILLSVGAAVEIIEKRMLYVLFFCGVLGFHALTLVGIFLGIVAGCITWILMFTLLPPNSSARVLDYLLERQEPT